MNQYKFTLLSGVVFRKDISGVCYTELGSNSLPLGKDKAVNLLADEVIGLKEIIEENKRQQEVTVHQFRQAQEELQRLRTENGIFRKALRQFVDMKLVRTAPELVIQMYSRYAQELLEGRGMEGDVK
ncbi:hypothetical protein LKL24_12395 [Bacillus halotolerans]|uniref:hypothetical protein n=1 Tax=Bacillus halotolerans TaxID=260554 RepID=UPI001D0EAF59|nr:hypothetical protein [Bacillus halotolerans]MCC2528215.1 hypothetical protein [Bacillus halotolerans]